MEGNLQPQLPRRTGIKREFQDTDSDSDGDGSGRLRPSSSTDNLFLPKAVMFDYEIPMINLKNHAKIGDPIEVVVPEVQSPHNFIIHLKKFTFELKKLMARMQSFYLVYDEKYSGIYYNFEKNDLCAVMYETNLDCKEWYRAKVLNFSQTFGGKSKVLLIDYGITVEVTNYHFKFLDESFTYLPAQAIRVHMTKVKPLNGRMWSEESCKAFYRLVFDKDLVAHVMQRNCQERWLGLELTYPGVATRISDMLVERNMALPQVRRESRYYDSFYPGLFLRPEDIGKVRRSRCELRDCGENKKHEGWYRFENRSLKKMFDVDDSDESSDYGHLGSNMRPLRKWRKRMVRGRRMQPAQGPSLMFH